MVHQLSKYFFLLFFQERRILEETVAPLTPTGLSNQQIVKTVPAPSPPGNKQEERSVPSQHHHHQNVSAGSEDQHPSKLHFFQGEAEPQTHFHVHTDFWKVRLK